MYSSTLKKAPWGEWEPAEIEDGDAVEHIRQMKKEEGNDMMVWGSLTLAKAGLVDEYQLRVCPVVLGEGRSFIPAGVKLDLQDTKTFPSGVVMLRYGVK